MRRQNRSCDQCRKAKRACNAAAITPLPGTDGDRGIPTRTCSYCQKTGKKCTYDWVRAQLAHARARNGALQQQHNKQAPCLRKTEGHGREEEEQQPPPFDMPGSSEPDVADMPDPCPATQDPWLYARSVTGSVDCGSDALVAAHVWGGAGDHFDFGPDNDLMNSITAQAAAAFLPTPHSAAAATTLVDVWSDCAAAAHTAAHTPDPLADPLARDFAQGGGPSSVSSTLSRPSAAPSSLSSAVSQAGRKRLRRGSTLPRHHSVSPFGIEQTLMVTSNNTLISENLFRVYHDVVEHNLCCWMTEDTCPYNIVRTGAAAAAAAAAGGGGGGGGSGMTTTTTAAAAPPPPPRQISQPEWGPVWPDRLYHWVMRLDRAALASGLIRMTRREDRAATRALHLAIMAFATQWAQQSARARETYDALLQSGISLADDTPSGFVEEFDRSLQRSIWAQAKRALQDCAEVESYRVVCAELIFGLAQKPWEDEDEDDVAAAVFTTPPPPPPSSYHHHNHHHPPSTSASNRSDGTSDGGGGGGSRLARSTTLAARLQHIISRDGPPSYMERAARKIRVLKFQFDAYDAGIATTGLGSVPPAAATMGAEERSTVVLLYWLAVMFDTVSSAMNDRPVVMGDEDCHPPDARPEMRTRRWWVELFMQKPGNTAGSACLRWPCSYEDAARTAVRLAPVKVILFRQVLYLQNALRNQRGAGAAGEHAVRDEIEDVIAGAMAIYRYWGATYTVFFRDLLQSYATAPPRLRSWFFCILAHWHLAALLLADLIELVDARGWGDPAASLARVSVGLVDQIRITSATELSDLAKVSTPPTASSSSLVNGGGGEGYLHHHQGHVALQLPTFHSAVAEGCILTEPWTVIVIRAFAKAFLVHLARAEDVWEHEKTATTTTTTNGGGALQSEGGRESLSRCEDCVRALWFLGKKSDMARSTAKVLGQALKEAEACLP